MTSATKKTISFQADIALVNALTAEAEKLGISRSELLRRYSQQGLNQTAAPVEAPAPAPVEAPAPAPVEAPAPTEVIDLNDSQEAQLQSIIESFQNQPLPSNPDECTIVRVDPETGNETEIPYDQYQPGDIVITKVMGEALDQTLQHIAFPEKPLALPPATETVIVDRETGTVTPAAPDTTPDIVITQEMIDAYMAKQPKPEPRKEVTDVPAVRIRRRKTSNQ